MFQVHIVEKIKTHFLGSVKFMIQCGKIWQSRKSENYHYDMVHALFILVN